MIRTFLARAALAWEVLSGRDIAAQPAPQPSVDLSQLDAETRNLLMTIAQNIAQLGGLYASAIAAASAGTAAAESKAAALQTELDDGNAEIERQTAALQPAPAADPAPVDPAPADPAPAV
jgi:hypothetical protein